MKRILNPDPVIATPAEIDAAQKTFKHNNTPSLSKLDSLGRTFYTESDNVTEKISGYTVLDIKGNELEVRDSPGRIVVSCEYDLSGRILRQTTMDAGSRWMIMDIENNPLLNWDERDHEFSFEYDLLRRPLRSIVKTANSLPQTFSVLAYGESLPLATAKDRNLLGAVYKTQDQSGSLINERNDFKGNNIETTRQFVAEYKNIVDWENAVSLESEIFIGRTEYDALNRPVKITSPHTALMLPSEVYPGYNEAGLLDTIKVKIRNAASEISFVSSITYNAKAQREEIIYGNGTKTNYSYEYETSRLKSILTTRNSGGEILQHLKYTYGSKW